MSNNLEKLKKFFRSSKTNQNQVCYYILTGEIERELKAENNTEKRILALRNISEIVMSNRLEEFAIQKLWALTNDLIESTNQEHRQFCLSFYSKLIQGQYKDLSMMRTHFFRLIQNHNIPEDLSLRLDMLRSLTDDGKDIQNFEEEIGIFMLKWIPQIIEANLTASYLEIVVNIMKYNTAYMDREIIVGIVQNVCNLSSCNDTATVLQCLNVIDVIICYTVFPNEILAICIIALCRTVNKEAHCQNSYKIMRNLLGTQLGYASLLTMCNIMNDSRYYVDEEILRGAVFHVNATLFGGMGLGSLQNGMKYSSTVLQSYLQVLKSKHLIVTYEVVLSIQTVIQKCGQELSEPSWDIVVSILESILANIESAGIPDNHDMMVRFHLVLDHLEMLIQKNEINVDVGKVYSVIEQISSKRSEASVKKLLHYKFQKISVTSPNWLKNLINVMERYYRQNANPSIRIATIDYLKDVINANRACFEEEILEKVVIVVFSDIAHEHDIKIRVSVCKLLLDICIHCDTKRCLELLDILEKVMNHPFELYSLDNVAKNENEFEDTLAVVNGLIDLFLEKLHQLPSTHAVKIYQILIGHLEMHYQQPKVFETAKNIRYSIVNWMLKVRANAAFQIGYPYPKLIGNIIRYSHFLAIEGEQHHAPQTPGLTDMTASSATGGEQSTSDANQQSFFNFTNLSIKRGCKVVVKCMENEKDWPTVQLVLRELPKIMQNKTLIQGNDIDILAKTLAKLFQLSYVKQHLVERFTSTNNQTPSQSDFRALVIPAIASLITYNSYLETSTKKNIAEILKAEVKLDSNRNLSICVQTFTILLMERCDIFERQLAEILLSISKVSDSPRVSIPILEFMSTITHLPYAFTNLNQKQFSYVFATCLPYTSPHRYDHYTVSLAHHIIASWFLKSRLQWRKKYADYIIEGIAKNIDKSMVDAKQQQLQKQAPNDGDKELLPTNLALMNEDSSNRKRSSSFTEPSRRRDVNNQQIRSKQLDFKQQQRGGTQNSPGFDMHNFHIELIETCIDFMARHTFSMSSPLPRRIPAADFLLRGGGQSKTWIVGHNVITIMTNACTDNHDYSSGSCVCRSADWAEITIRHPTGNVSWIMKFQNQTGGSVNDFTMHDLNALFSDEALETDAGGNVIAIPASLVKEFPMQPMAEPVKTVDTSIVAKKHISNAPTTASTDGNVFVFSTPIAIPQTKNEHEERDEGVHDPDDISFDDDSDSKSRNPVRRVNSSPEMRSNWKINMSNKNSKELKSGSSSKDTVNDETDDGEKKNVEEAQKEQKKKNYSKETKVSCEAIPEEVGAKEEPYITRPVQLLTSISTQETSNVTTMPKKQHSADDTFQLRRENASLNPKSTEWLSSNASNLPLSPRYNYKAVQNKILNRSDASENDDSGMRGRSKTISFIGRDKDKAALVNASPFDANKNNPDFSSSNTFEQQPAVASSGVNPSFVFVQLFNSGKINLTERPLLVNEKHSTSVALLDLIPPYEIHKIGVLYVGPGQANNETEILRNRFGSLRYTQFLHGLGSLVAIKDAKEQKLFVSLEANGKEGHFTYVWHDDIVQVTFHVATLMPSLESDPNCNEKKKHIGNDFATIVYNESGEDYNLNTITSQFNYACIVVQPLELGANLISVRAKGDIENYFKHLEPKIITDTGAPLFARQLALHANMASLVSTSLKNKNHSPYASNWLERLRRIKHLKSKLNAEHNQSKPPNEHINTTTTIPTTTSALLQNVFTKYT